MATKNGTGAAKAPRTAKTAAAQEGTEQPAGDALDFDEADELNCSLKNLLSLTEWIERARHLIDGVELVCERNEEISAALREYEIPIGDAIWDLPESCGLREVQILIYEKASKLGDGAVALAQSRRSEEVSHA